MPRIKQFFDRVERIIARLENTEAVTEARHRQARFHAEQAERQLTHLKQTCAEAHTDLTTKRAEVHQWQAQAVNAAQADEHTALHCIRFVRRLRNEIERLEDTVTQCDAHIAELEPLVLQAWTRYRTAAAGQRIRVHSAAAQASLHELDDFDKDAWVLDSQYVSPARNDAVQADDLASLRSELATLIKKHSRQEKHQGDTDDR